MPRTQKIHTDEDWEQARGFLRDGISLRNISRQTNIPLTTLYDHFKGKYTDCQTSFGPQKSLTDQEESTLVSYIIYMANCGYPLDRKSIKKFVVEMVSRNSDESKTFINLANGPSDKWILKFLQRHPEISLRKPHPLEGARSALKQDNINDYLNLLENALKEIDNDPCRIFNCDESGFSGRLSSSKKVFVPKKTRHAYQTQVNISGHITLLNAISASGSTSPSMLIFSGALQRGDVRAGIPESWMMQTTESGFITNDLFLKWAQEIFIPFIGRKRPVLLILDNHVSHWSLPFLELAKKHCINLLFFPSHSSHLLQPMDVVYFHNLKQKVADLSVALGFVGCKTLPRASFPKILQQALNLVLPATVSASFSDAGIYPLSRKELVQSIHTDTDPHPSSSTEISNIQTSPVCRTCGKEKESKLVKLGIIPKELANIFADPPEIKQTKSKRKNKQNPSYLSADHDSTNKQNSQPEEIDSPIPPKRKRGRPNARTKKTEAKQKNDMPNETTSVQENANLILCEVCMTDEDRFWVGCDRCDSWYHYECLPSPVQTEVDLSLIVDEYQWLCNKCRQEE